MNTREIRLILIVLAGLGTWGCANNRTQHVPTLSPAAAPTAPAQPQRNIVKEVGDTTWNVVTAPVRLVTPKKDPPKEPEVYEAPSAIFTRRNYGEEDAAGAPAATRP